MNETPEQYVDDFLKLHPSLSCGANVKAWDVKLVKYVLSEERKKSAELQKERNEPEAIKLANELFRRQKEMNNLEHQLDEARDRVAELERQVEEAKQELAYETKRFALNVATIEFAKRELVEGLKKSLIHKTFNFEEAKQLIEKHGND